MSVKFGFFDSVESSGVQDRVYSSTDFNEYFKGFMGHYIKVRQSDGTDKMVPQFGSGKFANVGMELQVAPLSGLMVSVGSGKALVDYHWYEQDASETITFAANQNASLTRIDRLVLRSNSNLTAYNGTPARSVELAIIQGTPSDPPVLPPINTYEDTAQDGIYELLLANVKIRTGASVITSSDIDQASSPIIRALLDQGQSLDLLLAQYTEKLNSMAAVMDNWFESKMNDWNSWFYDITNNLTVGGYIKSFHKHINSVQNSTIDLDMTNYTYQSDDVFLVTYNGLMLTRGVHYTIAMAGELAQLTLITSKVGTQTASDMDITVLKTNLSQRIEGTLGSATGTNFIHVSDVALGSRAYGFKINSLGTDTSPVMVCNNRNLADLSGIEAETSGGVTITPLTGSNAGKFLLEGSNTSGEDVVFTCAVSTKAFAYNGEYNISLDGSGDNLSDGVHFTIASIYEEAVTDIATADVGTPEVFVTNDTEDKTFPEDVVIFKITVDSDATEEFNYVISPMIEYGHDTHDFMAHHASEFIYGEGLPTFTDNFAYIYAKEDDQANTYQLIYYVLSEGSADNISY